MARITSYSLDQVLTTDDKVVGTDAATGTVRNYTVGNLSSFINTANLGNYTFDTTQTPGSGTDNFVLTYDNSTGKISLEVAASQAAFNVVEDLTPQLGGTLDANGQIIDMGTNNITDAKVGQWDTAYGWGDHSTQGYLTSYTEADTLDSVVGRGAVTTTTAVIPFLYANQAAFPNATTYHGAIAHSHADGAMYFAHSSAWVKLANDSDLANKSNWDTAYGWGDHSSAGYVTSSGVTSVTGTAPVVSSGGATPAISMAAATTSVNGYLTSTDWNTFNGKQGSITLTTTGTSGAATLVGTTLNIPQYSSGGGGGSGTVTEVTANAPLSVTSGTSTPDLTIAQATALANGYLSSANWTTFNNGATLAGTAQQPPSEGAFVDGDKTKLDAIEASADVTDAANVTSAGALMDSEVTNLAQVKAFSSADYATAAQGALADSAQQPPSEGAFVNGDKTKLDGIEASADVTDTTNVTSAGALMDSEVTNLAQVKAFDSSDYATAAQGTTADAALPKAGGAMSGAITGNQEITGRRPIVADTNTTINLTLGTHEGVFLYSDNGSAVTVNVPANSSQAFPVGTEIDIIQAGAGTVGLTPAGGVNLNGANTAIPITAQWGAVTIKQIVADNWIVVGKI